MVAWKQNRYRRRQLLYLKAWGKKFTSSSARLRGYMMMVVMMVVCYFPSRYLIYLSHGLLVWATLHNYIRHISLFSLSLCMCVCVWNWSRENPACNRKQKIFNILIKYNNLSSQIGLGNFFFFFSYKKNYLGVQRDGREDEMRKWVLLCCVYCK